MIIVIEIQKILNSAAEFSNRINQQILNCSPVVNKMNQQISVINRIFKPHYETLNKVRSILEQKIVLPDFAKSNLTPGVLVKNVCYENKNTDLNIYFRMPLWTPVQAVYLTYGIEPINDYEFRCDFPNKEMYRLYKFLLSCISAGELRLIPASNIGWQISPREYVKWGKLRNLQMVYELENQMIKDNSLLPHAKSAGGVLTFSIKGVGLQMSNYNSPLSTVTLKQLLMMRPQYAAENIFELANKGHFGLYIKPHRERKTQWDVKDHIKNSKVPLLEEKLLSFAKDFEFLLENKPGYERLATKAEVEILGICFTGSVELLLKYGEVPSFEYNNCFGIVFEGGKYLSRSYLFQRMPCIAINERFKEKAAFTIEDIFVFVDQIERFEANIGDVMPIKVIAGEGSNSLSREDVNKISEAPEEISDIVKSYEVGKKKREQVRKFGILGGKTKKAEAKEKWNEPLARALEEVKKQVKGYYTAINLATQVQKKFPQINIGTFRKLLSDNHDIAPFLKLHHRKRP